MVHVKLMQMQYQIELKLHGQNHTIDIVDNDFALYLYRNVTDDFEIEGNNSRLVLLHSYVRKVYELYLQQKSTEQVLHKIELLT